MTAIKFTNPSGQLLSTIGKKIDLDIPIRGAFLVFTRMLQKIAATPESSRTYTHQGKHQALRLRWTAADILSASPPFDFTDAEQELVENSFEFIDEFFASFDRCVNQGA